MKWLTAENAMWAGQHELPESGQFLAAYNFEVYLARFCPAPPGDDKSNDLVCLSAYRGGDIESIWVSPYAIEAWMPISKPPHKINGISISSRMDDPKSLKQLEAVARRIPNANKRIETLNVDDKSDCFFFLEVSGITKLYQPQLDGIKNAIRHVYGGWNGILINNSRDEEIHRLENEWPDDCAPPESDDDDFEVIE